MTYLFLRRNRLYLMAAFLVLAVIGGVIFAQWSSARAEDSSPFEDVRTLLEVVALLKTHYVEPVETFDLVNQYVRQGSINGMLREALDDPYTRFMDAPAYRQVQSDIEGSFGGIGIVVGMQDEQLTIISPIVNTPGFRAGLRGGDRITHINGAPTTYMSLDEAVTLMRGEENTEITLGIQRGGQDGTAKEVHIVRDIIEVPSVSKTEVVGPEQASFLTSRLGYIQVASFSEKTVPQLDQALQSLGEAGVEGLVIDLRNNPGGPLNAALEMSNRFLEDGPIVHLEGRDGERRTWTASPFGTQPRIPIVILVNEFSASASEIVAGALRDQDKAKLVGTTTFGKGLVQTVVPLRGGSALSLTTARYQTAGGHYIHEKGIVPDVVVEVPDEEAESAFERMAEEGVSLEDPQIRKALEVLEQEIRQSVASRWAG